MTKSDFVDWKHHPVTEEVFRKLQTRVRELQELLGTSAGLDPLIDRLYVGAISAYNDILNIEYEEDTND